MSRIGKKPITIPDGVQVSISADNLVAVKGKLGELRQQVDAGIQIKIDNGVMELQPVDPQNQDLRAKHGLYRSLLNNMVTGVSIGFTVKQELVGVGYKVTSAGQVLEFSLGYSHNLFFELPAEVKAETISERGKNPMVILTSHDKQLLGMVTSKIRSFRPPEPYKGKGIKFENEVLRRKAGKSASSK